LEIVAALEQGVGSRSTDPHRRDTKWVLARVWTTRQLPLIESLCQRVESGNASLMALADALV
jgi:hypothetical protein